VRDSSSPLISVVIPCFNEEHSLPTLFAELEEQMTARPDYRYEIVAVDDGSSDGTLPWLRQKVQSADYLKVLSLSRNFGSHASILAGMRSANGDAVTFIAADLQDPPELIARLADRWKEGHSVVWALRKTRDDPWITRAMSWLAHRVFAWLTALDVPAEGVDVFLAERRVVEAVTASSWRNCSVLMAFFWAGFPSSTVDFEKRVRQHGSSKWNLRKRVRLFIDMTVGFSSRPMRLISGVGLMCALVGFAYAVVIGARWAHGAGAVEGWSSLMIVTLIIGGLVLCSLGVLGEYLWRALDESRRRPMYLVGETLTPATEKKETKANST
jgi:glycosyltransferase involved in cell wall biosynthesis